MASALKTIIEQRVHGSQVWVSSVDIEHGQQWLKSLDTAIEKADTVLVLCSKASVNQPWVNFEGGVGWGRKARVVPICHSDLTITDLPFPLSALQGHNLFTIHDLNRMLKAFAGAMDDLDAAWTTICDARESIDYVPPAVQPLPVPATQNSILLDGAHGQTGWPQTRKGTLFEWAKSGFGGLIEDAQWEVQLVESANQIRARDMSAWKGMILALPWRNRIASSTIEQIVEWVRAGGRLLLLGFELGDLHHGGNLNELAARFGLRFHGDMVAPEGWQHGKPYGKDVRFSVESTHRVLQGIQTVVWRNVQTLALEPGTNPLITVGSGALVVPTPDSVGFTEGFLTMPSPEFVIVEGSGWLPVLAQATPHLTGSGAVLACGTWDVLPQDSASSNNEQFVKNVLGWLVGG